VSNLLDFSNGKFTRMHNSIFDELPKYLTLSEQSVFNQLYHNSVGRKEPTNICDGLSVQDIANTINISNHGVRKALQSLDNKGLITTLTSGKGRGKKSSYEIADFLIKQQLSCTIKQQLSCYLNNKGATQLLLNNNKGATQLSKNSNSVAPSSSASTVSDEEIVTLETKRHNNRDKEASSKKPDVDNKREEEKNKLATSKDFEEKNNNEGNNTTLNLSNKENHRDDLQSSKDQTNDKEAAKLTPLLPPLKDQEQDEIKKGVSESQNDLELADIKDLANQFFEPIFDYGKAPYQDRWYLWYEAYNCDEKMLRKVLTSEVPNLSSSSKFQEKPDFARQNAYAHLLDNPKASRVLSDYLKRKTRLQNKTLDRKPVPTVGYEVLLKTGQVVTVEAIQDDVYFSAAYKGKTIEMIHIDKIKIANSKDNQIDLSKYTHGKGKNYASSQTASI